MGGAGPREQAITLPTEEDVLAVLVLWACRPVVTNIYDSTHVAERNAYDQARRFKVRPVVAELASERRRSVESLEAAIADSERRLEAWECEQEVLEQLRSFEYPRGSEIRVLDQEPTHDEVLRWAWTMLGGRYQRLR